MGLTSGLINLSPVPQNVVAFDANGTLLYFDVSMDEHHSKHADITDYPIDQGSNISDNAQKRPDRVTVHGFFSDFPIGPVPVAPSLSTGTGNEAYDLMAYWMATSTPVTLITTLETYDVVLIEDLGVPRHATNTNGVEASVTFKELATAQSLTVAAPKPTKPSMNGNTNVGAKTGAALAGTEARNTSLLYQLTVGP